MADAATEHVRQLAAVQLRAVRHGHLAWRRVNRWRIAASWQNQLRTLVPLVSSVQLDAATLGTGYVAEQLAEQGSWVAPAAFADPRTLAGTAPDGRSLEGLLYSPAATALARISEGTRTATAMIDAGLQLEMLLHTLMADTSRTASSIDIATRPGVGWIRMVNPPCCARCAVLAGRFYRWNDGFLRHPRCDCVHRPAHESSLDAARSEGLVQDPYEYFKSLSPADQDRVFTASGAQAIRDGADINRVVNARRGMTPNGMFTTEGMGRRGFARKNLKATQRRMTPAQIYKLHPNRAEALRELERHGYIHRGGQNPLGSIKGAFYEGYGQMGRGGTRKAASAAVDLARETGVRTGSRATMTAAERRLYDAKLRWDIVLQGRNPYARRSGPAAPLTPQIAATVEAEYRRLLATNGQTFVTTDDALTQARNVVIRAAN